MTKTNWIDIEELKKQLDFSEVLRHYGVELKLKGDQHHGFCPLPLHKGKKNSASFSANVKRGIWQCFGCGQHGNLLDLAVLMEKKNPKNGKDVHRVATKLTERFLFGFGIPHEQAERLAGESEKENVLANAPLDFELKGLDEEHPYLLSRGFTAETIERFGLGYCSRGFLRGRIVVPLHDGEGKLVGYAGRITDDKAISEENPKYKFPGRRKRKGVINQFRKSLFLYNAHRISAPVDDILVVVEGFTSVWCLFQAGIRNVVALMGASCSAEQGRAIVSLTSSKARIWALPDGDNAGRRCLDDLHDHVSPHRSLSATLFDEGKQPTSFSVVELRNLFRSWPTPQ